MTSNEYILAIGTTLDAETQSRMVRFDLRTVREFSAFGYSIETQLSTSRGMITIEVGGITIPRAGGGESGPARASILSPIPNDGDVKVVIKKRKLVAEATLTVRDGNVVSVEQSPLEAPFITITAE